MIIFKFCVLDPLQGACAACLFAPCRYLATACIFFSSRPNKAHTTVLCAHTHFIMSLFYCISLFPVFFKKQTEVGASASGRPERIRHVRACNVQKGTVYSILNLPCPTATHIRQCCVNNCCWFDSRQSPWYIIFLQRHPVNTHEQQYCVSSSFFRLHPNVVAHVALD